MQATNYKLIEHPNRWRLVYLDFPNATASPELADISSEITILKPTGQMCCVYQNQLIESSCECGPTTMVRFFQFFTLDFDFNFICSNIFQFKTIFLADLLTRLISLLRTNTFEMHSVKCSPAAGNVTDDVAVDFTDFENQLRTEFPATPNLVQFVANTTNQLEYYLSLGIIGRDGSDVPLLVNESPIIIELAVVDNGAIIVTSNVTIKGPRRFFRIGIAPALPWSYIKINEKTGEPMLDDMGNVIWEGYCIDFAAKLAEVLDFDYELVPTKNGLFGDRVPNMNNTWDGLVGDLMVGVSLFIFYIISHEQ